MQEEEANLELAVEIDVDPQTEIEIHIEIQPDATQEVTNDAEFVREDSCSEEMGENVNAINECSPEGPIIDDDEFLDEVDIALTGEGDLETTFSTEPEIPPAISLKIEGETNDECIDDTIARFDVHAGLEAPIVHLEVEVGGGRNPEDQKSPCCSIYLIVLGVLMFAASVAMWVIGTYYT